MPRDKEAETQAARAQQRGSAAALPAPAAALSLLSAAPGKLCAVEHRAAGATGPARRLLARPHLDARAPWGRGPRTAPYTRPSPPRRPGPANPRRTRRRAGLQVNTDRSEGTLEASPNLIPP